MNKVFKVLLYVILSIIVLIVLIWFGWIIKLNINTNENLALLGNPSPTLTIDGFTFRDLNKNGTLDIYEDSRQTVENRVNDLVSQMTLEEKAGAMFITMIGVSEGGGLSETPDMKDLFSFFLPQNSEQIAVKKMNHFNIIQSKKPYDAIGWYNTIQQTADKTRLGIPITIATDPRHGSENNVGATVYTPYFTQWCSPLGLAATRNPQYAKEFGEFARQEYREIGITMALHPMADLATEPRWARIGGTFGEEAELATQFTKAYIEGFQGNYINGNSVACMAKHFSGGGPQKDGEDAHFGYGKEQAYPGDNFDYHLIPFEKGVFPANPAAIMPYYGIPVGQTNEDVGFGYNKEIITGLLRNTYKYDNIICTDWGLVTSMLIKEASAWGVEHLTEKERALKIIEAGCDMFGGEQTPQWIIELVKEGKISEDRIDSSVKRIMKLKFELALFDNPYINQLNAGFLKLKKAIEKSKEVQRKSLVLLKNNNDILPLKKGIKVFTFGFDKKCIEPYAEVVGNVNQADVILMHLYTPYEERSGSFLENFFHQGSLAFSEKKKKEILAIMKQKPTVIIFSMDRPPVIPEINKHTDALVADFFCQENILMDLVFGEFEPSGKLPFEIPSSMEAVEKQKEDVPFDSENPLYNFGYGLSYNND